MTGLRNTTLHCDDWRAIDATAVRGHERELIDQIFRDRIDVVFLPDASPDSRRRFLQAGIPWIDADSLQLWRAPATTRPYVGDWKAVPGDWHSTCQHALATLLGPAAAIPHALDGTYWWNGGRAMVRRRGGTLEVTAVPLDEAATDELADALSGLAGPAGMVAVPVRQSSLAARLATRGFVPDGFRAPALLLPMLHASQRPVLLRDFVVSPDDVARFGAASGDMNPLHFDETYARKLGFEGRIAHGMLFHGWVTRLLGMEYPGAGTIFLGNATTFSAPVYPGRSYEARASIPIADGTRGTFTIVVQLRSTDGGMVAISRSEVMRRSPAGAGP